MSRPLFDALSDRLIFLSPEGKILFANQSGRDALADRLAGLERCRALVEALRDIAAGRRQLPLTLTLELINAAGIQTVQATLAAAPNGRDLALVLPDASGDSQIRNAIDSFLELVRTQLQQPLTELQRHCAALEDVDTLAQDTAALAGDMSGKLSKLLDLIKVLGCDDIVGDDRVLLVPLIHEVLAQLQPQSVRYRIRVVTSGLASDMPPVYGSRDWLRRALSECVENAYKHSREDCGPQAEITVEVRARQEPEHVLLQIINQGACPFGLANGKAVPFVAPSGRAIKAPANQGGTPASGVAVRSAPAGLRIGLALSQKIVEMHGGHLRFLRTDEDMTDVRIELPTGGSRRRNERLDTQQAQRYAQDLALLLARRKNNPAPAKA